MNQKYQQDRQSGWRTWRKVLYERQNFSDNYVDTDKFLDNFSIDTNQNNHQTFFDSYIEMLISCSVIVQQITVVAIFLTIFKYIVLNKLSDTMLLLLNIFGMVFGLIVFFILDDREKNNRNLYIFESLRYVFVFGVCIRASAPIFQTLTENFSDDTIYAIVLILASTHLVFYNYTSFHHSTQSSYLLTQEQLLMLQSSSSSSSMNFNSRTTSTTTMDNPIDTNHNHNHNHNIDSTQGILSLNAAMFTAIVLASRLKNVITVAEFCLLAVQLFFLLPDIAKLVRRTSVLYHLFFTLFLWCIASALLLQLNAITLFAVYQNIIIFLWFICSLWLVYMQRNYKRFLRGPWEEAKVD